MDEAGFRQMLLARGNAPTGVETRINYLKTIEKNLAGLGLPFADLDAAFEADLLASVTEAIRGLISDHKAGGTGYLLLFPRSENPGNRLANLPTFLKHYRDYRSGAGMADSDADRIRQYALKHFVQPARDQRESSVTIRAGDLHNALGLSNAHANVCQALRGRLFRNLAGVGQTTVTGPENSSTTTFIFTLSPAAVAPRAKLSKEAMMMATPSTNLILYGPPGTGKTFATAREAVKLCSPEVNFDDRTAVEAEYRRLVEARQVEFVTFHQSYSYEDFVEGLRPPVSSSDGEGDDEKSGFRLEISPGVFHRIATRAAASKGSTGKSFDLTGRRVFKMSIGEASNPDDAYLFEEALAEGYTLLGYGELDWSDARFSDRQAIMDAWRQSPPPGVVPTAHSGWVQFHDKFRNSMRLGDLVVISKGNGTFRAIGEVSGDYEFSPRPEGDYAHRRAVNWLWSDAAGLPVQELVKDKRFMMKSIYELNRADLNLAALERLISTGDEAGGPPEPFVLIIDEINRANISKVFGELITLLEPDKRTTPEGGGLKVRLPYSKEAFGVPANLHVIGTMNTADRSIALLDTALRRRFEFRELMPDPELPELKTASASCGVHLGKLLRTLNDRIEYLFDREHQIGHAYFIKCASRDNVDAVMRHKVIPLLAEYFYEDWSKVALVLGDADTGKPGRFLERAELKPPTGSDFEGGDTRWRWTVRSEFAADAYADFQ